LSKGFNFNLPKIAALFVAIFLFSCKDQSKQPAQKDIEQEEAKLKVIVPQDTLVPQQKNPYRDISYGKDFAAEKIGKLFLVDSMIPMDNEATFKCLKAICSIDNKHNDFYFSVLMKITSRSDGALSEVMGSYLIKYIENNTDFFLTKLEKLSNEKIDRIAHYAVFEFSCDEDIKKEKKWCDALSKKCKNYTPEQLLQLGRFIKCIKSNNININ
jgi:hypothetical protein